MIVFLFSCSNQTKEPTPSKPNVVIIYVDDLGYGDVGYNGAIGVETPNIDNLASNGIVFTDGHCSASTCTPSRFSLLTGKYAFRNEAAILPGDAPLLIRPGTPTLPGMFKKAGYKTAVVGKWHLGLGDGNVNWNSEIKPGPLEIGFDYSFLIPATGDRVPCVFVENHHVVGLDPADPITVSYSEMVGDWPTGISHPGLLKVKADRQHSQTIVNGISRIGTMTGGKSALWVDEDFPDVLTQKAKDFIVGNKDNPFFLFFSYHDIHVPRIPHPRFVGVSSMGPRGDVIAQMDWCTGEIVKELEKLGLAENTLIIFSSDNGPVLDDGYSDDAVEKLGKHNPSGPFRGGKYSAYEAGTRVPTITYWPSVIEKGKTDAMFNQVDLYASLATLVGQKLAPEDAPDSFDCLPAMLGKSNKGRNAMIEEAFVLAYREGDWKYIEPGTEAPSWITNKRIESGMMTEPQLFNLANDLGEQNNVATQFPEKAEEMRLKLEGLVEKGRSRPE